MSDEKYYAAISEIATRYAQILDDDQKYWTSTHNYIRHFLNNLLIKVEEKDNLFKLNREVGYATRIMIELEYVTVSSERHYYQRVFWPLDGGEPYV